VVSLLRPDSDWHEELERRRREARYYWDYGRQRANAQWTLRHCTRVGVEATVLGRATVDATDMVAGDHFKVWSGHRRTLITGWGRIRIGDRVFVNSGAVIFSTVEVTLGDDVAIANEAYLTDSDSHGVEGRPAKEAPIRIGAGSWVGARAMILPGVTVGTRCLIAAGAIVSKDVPDETLVAGNPARVVRQLHYPEGVRRAWHDG
jgi:acetyltransferase-like isoleucine patch superfamily enzyme